MRRELYGDEEASEYGTGSPHGGARAEPEPLRFRWSTFETDVSDSMHHRN